MDLRSHRDIERFAIRDYRAFWRTLLETQLPSWSGEPDPACVGEDVETARFFPDVRLNYADNLLSTDFPDGAVCLTAIGADGRATHLTRRDLRARVEALAGSLRRLGLGPDDRVIAICGNGADAVVVALAVAAVGAVYASTSAEAGVEAIVDRFAQVEPALLFALAAPTGDGPGGKDQLSAIVAGLPSLTAVIAVEPASLAGVGVPVHDLRDLAAGEPFPQAEWPRLPFSHPLFVMFSSGTTGRPKAIVHGAGGVLLEHIKEHRLHCDIGEGDTLFFHTSCSWMMWNWQLSALASGVRIVVFEGAIDRPDALWRVVAAEDVTLFGTSPAYLRLCAIGGFVPAEHYAFRSLRTVLSTGSPLLDEQFRWVRENAKDVPVHSISGGTDILGCFLLGSPLLPVRDGESPCRSLAMDVRALGATGDDPVGELVCANPFPSRPLGFLGDADGSRFHDAYFAQHPRFWTHGDLVSFSDAGSARLHGRSDGVMNIRGIRIGPAEIHAVVLAMPEVAAAMAVARPARSPEMDDRLILLLVLRDDAPPSDELLRRIRSRLATAASRAHVPDVIVPVSALPVTWNGKQSEAAATAALAGRAVRNLDALANPRVLDEIRLRVAQAEGRGDEGRETSDGPAASGASLETFLCRLWEELLRTAPIGPDDDFFELGGNSLVAARMLARVCEATGHDLPLNTLLHAPTIARLLATLTSGLPVHRGQIVVLRPGDPEAAPLFMIHSMSGNVMELWALARSLATTRTVYGIEARVPAPDRAATIAGLAEDYADLIRSVRPEGPYLIGGYSMGGLVAVEIARRLADAGERIERLILLDPLVHPGFLRARERLAYLLMRPSRAAAVLLEMPPGERLAHLRQSASIACWRLLDRVGIRPALPEAVFSRQSRGFSSDVQRMREAMRLAWCRYRPTPLAIAIDLICPSRTRAYGCAAVWRRVARSVALHTVPGDHHTMILDHAQALPRALDRILEVEAARSMPLEGGACPASSEDPDPPTFAIGRSGA